MKSIGKLFSIAGILLFVLSACNLQLNSSTQDPLSAASTIVAMTLQAQGLPTSQGLLAATPFASPVVSTPTTKPNLVINKDNTKCRNGPSTDFKVVASYNAGTKVDLVARDTVDSYWVVKDPSSGSTCWVQAQDATPGGSFDSLPEITPQASTSKAPARPGSIIYTYSCNNNSVTTNLSWADNANNENGYHIYRLGSQIADLPPNSTSYTDTVGYTLGSQMTYAVEAYNDAGASQQRSISFTCGE